MSTRYGQRARRHFKAKALLSVMTPVLVLIAGHNGDAKPPARSPFANSEKFPAKLDKGEAFKKLKTLVSAKRSGCA